MNEFSTITSKGQVTLPKDIRDRLKLFAGDKVHFTIVDDRVIMTPKNLNFNDLVGLLGNPPSGPLTLHQINEGIGKGISRHMGKDPNPDGEPSE